MGLKEKTAYLQAIRQRYRQANRIGKKRILDEFCAICGYNRKYAIRLLNNPKRKCKHRPGRKSKYRDSRFLEVLVHIWKATDFMCSRRLKTAIELWFPFYEQSFGTLTDETRTLLHSISRASLDRILHPYRSRYGKGLCGTKPGTLLRNQIPIRTNHWDITLPGYMEADTVAHCGNSLAGDFIWSLVLTDIHTSWTECRAVWNKGAHNVVEQIKHIEKHVPFKLLGFNCDNGSEFLNYHLVHYFTKRKAPVRFTRSRPYKKNDNAHVEQKNWAQARQLLGYERIDNPDILPLINDLYANEWSLYQNHFCPSMKLISKNRIGSRYRKTYDEPKIPYRRVFESKDKEEKRKEHLENIHAALNPFLLKRSIERKLEAILKNITVTSILRQR